MARSKIPKNLRNQRSEINSALYKIQDNWGLFSNRFQRRVENKDINPLLPSGLRQTNRIGRSVVESLQDKMGLTNSELNAYRDLEKWVRNNPNNGIRNIAHDTNVSNSNYTTFTPYETLNQVVRNNPFVPVAPGQTRRQAVREAWEPQKDHRENTNDAVAQIDRLNRAIQVDGSSKAIRKALEPFAKTLDMDVDQLNREIFKDAKDVRVPMEKLAQRLGRKAKEFDKEWEKQNVSFGPDGDYRSINELPPDLREGWEAAQLLGAQKQTALNHAQEFNRSLEKKRSNRQGNLALGSVLALAGGAFLGAGAGSGGGGAAGGGGTAGGAAAGGGATGGAAAGGGNALAGTQWGAAQSVGGGVLNLSPGTASSLSGGAGGAAGTGFVGSAGAGAGGGSQGLVMGPNGTLVSGGPSGGVAGPAAGTVGAGGGTAGSTLNTGQLIGKETLKGTGSWADLGAGPNGGLLNGGNMDWLQLAKDWGPTVAGGLLGGDSAGESQTTTTQSGVPEWARPYIQGVAQEGANLYAEGAGGIPRLSESTKQGLLGIGDLDYRGGYDRSGLMQMKRFASGETTNPYINQVIDASLDPVQERINSQFGRSGRYGSSYNQRLMTEEMADAASRVAMPLYESERGRQFQAARSMPQMNAQYLQNQAYGPGLSLGVGQYLDEYRQMKKNYPWQRLSNYSSILSGTPLGQNTTQTTGGGSRMAGILGGALLGSRIGESIL